MSRDYLLDGRGYGPVGEKLGGMFDYGPGIQRPYIGDDGRKYVTINTGKTKWDVTRQQRVPVQEVVRVKDIEDNGLRLPIFNATALRKEEWLVLDKVVVRAARFRLRAWADLAAANSYGGFNGMAKMILEHETMSDPGEAIVDMDGLTEGRTDAPQWQLQGVPLPITHSDFYFSSRILAISRGGGGMPLDTTMGEAAGRRVAESIEKTTIGTYTGITYGGASTQVGGYGRNSSVYGYVNFPNRIIYSGLSKPTDGGWGPVSTLNSVLAMKDILFANKFYGPFMLYHSNDWDQYMDNDYQVFTVGGSNYGGQMTLRERLKKIEQIADVRRLDFLFGSALTGPGSDYNTLNPFTLIMVQMTPEVARAVNGMDITTVQWESVGGMRLNFKVMAIQVPQLRADFYNNCGILQATGG